MKRLQAVLSGVGILAFLGASLWGLAMPAPVHAGDIHISIGLGIPFPIAVAPAPVVVVPRPIIVQPAPIVVYPSPVVVTEPHIVYKRLPPGLAKKYYGHHHYGHHYGHHHYGHHPAYGYNFYKHKKYRYYND